jgi:hypothetical protein
MRYESEKKKFRYLFDETLRLLSLYRKSELTEPFALKGNLGEFLTVIDLMEKFQQYEVSYKGGAFPGIDITIGNQSTHNLVKIQVKTQIKQPPNKYYDRESAPTIKKSIIEEKKCDFIVLKILYPDNAFETIKKTNTYVFGQSDFKYFSHIGCWSGKSKHDYTIYHMLRTISNPPTNSNRWKVLKHYNTENYHKLFKSSKNNWGKITRMLQNVNKSI